MNTKIRYIKKVPIMKLIFGFVLFCFGIHGAIFNNVFNLVLSGIGVFLMLAQGSEIDLKTKRYRELYTVLGIDLGKWKNLPVIEYISVFATSESSKVQAMGASANFKNKIIKLNLFYNTNKKIEAYRTEDVSDAFNVAKHFSEVLNIDILDATEQESKWL
ncbi:hypothetical protein A9Q87_10010 [Flavobacteriales bacterium 34_180_T64]|nr:hypothetical protein A9Q87_10010 [Flavobacteriales bacterium 34_180_T64]